MAVHLPPRPSAFVLVSTLYCDTFRARAQCRYVSSRPSWRFRARAHATVRDFSSANKSSAGRQIISAGVSITTYFVFRRVVCVFARNSERYFSAIVSRDRCYIRLLIDFPRVLTTQQSRLPRSSYVYKTSMQGRILGTFLTRENIYIYMRGHKKSIQYHYPASSDERCR